VQERAFTARRVWSAKNVCANLTGARPRALCPVQLAPTVESAEATVLAPLVIAFLDVVLATRQCMEVRAKCSVLSTTVKPALECSTPNAISSLVHASVERTQVATGPARRAASAFMGTGVRLAQKLVTALTMAHVIPCNATAAKTRRMGFSRAPRATHAPLDTSGLAAISRMWPSRALRATLME
jgi:hypothetical protein